MKVLVSDKLSDVGINMIKNAGLEVDVKTGLPEADLIKIIGDYDALVIRSETKVTPAVISAANKLKIIARAGVGVDNVDLPAATAKGIIVVNSPEGNTIAAAEQTMAIMLSMVRNTTRGEASFREGKWERSKLKGIELYNKTLGVVGLGKIGARVAQYGLAFGMKVIGTDPFVTEEKAKALGIELKPLEEVLQTADILTFHVPKNKDTLHMINKDSIAKMKKGVRMVNCARGGIIDEAALAEALASGQVKGAALDVFEKEPPDPTNPLFSAPNTVLCPHLGASTEEAQENVAIDVVEQVIEVLKGGLARTPVNLPSLKPEILGPAKPYMNLADKLGSLASQLLDGTPSEVSITYAGEVGQIEVAPLTISILKGILSPRLDVSVNFVNAPILAKEKNITVTESKKSETSNFSNLISLKIKSEAQTVVVDGSVFVGHGDYIVGIDGFRTDVVPSGYLLVANHTDKPGIVGKVGTLLGKNNINIASMDVGRLAPGGKAVMVLTVDSDIPEKVLQEISKEAGLTRAKVVKL